MKKATLCTILAVCVLCVLSFVGCTDSTKTPEATDVPTSQPTAVVTEQPTATLEATATPVPTATSEPTPKEVIDYDNALYLSDLYGTEKTLYWIVTWASSEDEKPSRVPGIDANYNMTEGPMNIGGEEYEKGISLHPREDVDSEIIFDISSYDYKYFTADIGPEDNGTRGIKGLIYLDYGEGFEEVYVTEDLLYSDIESVIIELKGAQKIKLAVNNSDGTHISDSTGFGNCMLYNIILA